MADDDDSAQAHASRVTAAEPLALASASRATADAYLEEQIRLARLQAENLVEQNAYELSHLRWRRFNDQMRGALQIMLVALGLVVVVALAAAMWNASRADGIVVEQFSVPPSYAAMGIGGDAVASDLTSKIAQVRDIANGHSLSQSKDVREDRDADVRVEIPDTGISLVEAWHYLRLWLGNERPLRGNLRAAGDGTLTLTVSVGGDSFTLRGKDLDGLETQAAERVFADADPGNYVLYLNGRGRYAEALAAAGRNASLPWARAVERSDTYALWADMTHDVAGDLPLALARAKIGVALDPKTVAPHMEWLSIARDQGHDEEVLAQARSIVTKRREDETPAFQATGYGYAIDAGELSGTVEIGDFGAALREECSYACSPSGLRLRRAEYAARDHDPAQALALIAEAQAMGDPLTSPQALRARYFTDAARNDWPAAVADARAYADAIRADNPQSARLAEIIVRTRAAPLRSVALARGGDWAAAAQAIAASPPDCYDCERARAWPFGGLRDHALDPVFELILDRAIASAPSIPFAYVDRGELALLKGWRDEAIAQFALAHQKGPHFADPLELWGEVLIAKNRSDLALAKFDEAARDAPNWGRLHLKWGEALKWSGDPDGAARQFAQAAALYLTAAERKELANSR